MHFRSGNLTALVLLTCTLTLLLLLLTNSLPDNTRKGFRIACLSFAGLSVLTLLIYARANPIPLCMSALLLLLFCIPAWKQQKLPEKIAAACMLWVLIPQIGSVLRQTKDFQSSEAWLLCAAAALLGFILLCTLRRLHTDFSDTVFPCSAAVYAITAINKLPAAGRGLSESRELFIIGAGACILAVTVVIYWVLALAHDTKKPVQHLYALLVPSLLGTLAFVLFDRDVLRVSPLMTLWSSVSLIIGLTTYLTVRKRFHSVRKLLFVITVVPPIIWAVIAENIVSAGWVIAMQLICAAASALIYVLFARRGFRVSAAAALTAAVLLLCEATGYALREYVYSGVSNFTLLMISTLWIAALSIAAIVIRRRILFFVGSDIIPGVMQFLTPLTALWLACFLTALDQPAWDSFYFVFTLLICLLAWFVTRPDSVLMPSVTVLTLIVALEALRSHSGTGGAGYLAFLICCFAALTVLLPYLGIVLREQTPDREPQRRGWALTFGGGMIPFWAAAVSAGLHDTGYSAVQCDWLRFFVPVLLAGYILHFQALTEDASNKRGIRTAASK